MNKIKDQECAKQLDIISGESISTTEVADQVNTKIQGQILEDAFTFCRIDDKDSCRDEELQTYRELLETDAFNLASFDDLFSLSPVIKSGFCSDEFYTA